MIIKVAARKLKLPADCPCCFGSADSEYEAVATRITGKRVIHETSRSWKFPYCRRCLLHAFEWKAGQAQKSNIYFVLVVCLFIGIISLIIKPWIVFPIAVIEAVWVVVLLVKWHSFELDSHRHVGDDCVCSGFSVEYHGWYGADQTFWLAHGKYAYHFAQANKAKVVGLPRLPPDEEPQSELRIWRPQIGAKVGMAVIGIGPFCILALVATALLIPTSAASPQIEPEKTPISSLDMSVPPDMKPTKKVHRSRQQRNPIPNPMGQP